MLTVVSACSPQVGCQVEEKEGGKQESARCVQQMTGR